jgi:hypothetical protein
VTVWASAGASGLQGVPLDTITDAILAGSPNSGYSEKASPIPKPRAEVRVLPGALSEFGMVLLPFLKYGRYRPILATAC